MEVQTLYVVYRGAKLANWKGKPGYGPSFLLEW